MRRSQSPQGPSSPAAHRTQCGSSGSGASVQSRQPPAPYRHRNRRHMNRFIRFQGFTTSLQLLNSGVQIGESPRRCDASTCASYTGVCGAAAPLAEGSNAVGALGGVLTPEKPIQVGGTHTQFYFAVLQRVQHEWCKYVNRLQGGDSTADTTPILLVLCTSVTEGVCDDVAM